MRENVRNKCLYEFLVPESLQQIMCCPMLTSFTALYNLYTTVRVAVCLVNIYNNR